MVGKGYREKKIQIGGGGSLGEGGNNQQNQDENHRCTLGITLCGLKLWCTKPMSTESEQVAFWTVYILPLRSVSSQLNTVRSRFVTVRFTAIHFYNPCRVGPNTPECHKSSVLSVLSALLALFRCTCAS